MEKKKIVKPKAAVVKSKTVKPETEVKPKPAARKKSPAKKGEVKFNFGMHNLKVPHGGRKRKKILGRGPGSGHGKTSTRGSKGQTSRAGRHFYLGFEGGQTPIIRRMPKRGFSNISFKHEYQIVNLDQLNRIAATDINPQILAENGLVRDGSKPVKILGNGQIKKPVNMQAHAFSKKALQEIQKAGGKTELIK